MNALCQLVDLLRWIVILSALSLIGCTAQYSLQESERFLKNSTLVDSYRIQRQHNGRVISRAADIYIVRNVTEPNKFVKDRVSVNLESAFSHYFNSAMASSMDEDLWGALKSARSFKSQYLLIPKLEIWNGKTKRWQNFRYEQVVDTRLVRKALRPGGKEPRHWKVSSKVKMQKARDIKRLRLELRLIDVVSEQQVDNIWVTAKAGLISGTANRPLERFNKPLMALAKQLSGL